MVTGMDVCACLHEELEQRFVVILCGVNDRCSSPATLKVMRKIFETISESEREREREKERESAERERERESAEGEREREREINLEG